MACQTTRKNYLARVRLSSVFAYLVWTFVFCGKAFGLTSRDSVYTTLIVVSMVFACMHLLMQLGSKKEFAFTLASYGLGVLTWRLSGDASLFLAVIVVSLLKDLDLKSLFLYTFVVYGAIAATRLFLGTIGILDSEPIFFYERGEIRYGLGFGQPNSAQSVITFFIALICLLRLPKKRKVVYLLFAMCFAMYIYSFTGSRSGMWVAIFLSIGFLIPEGFKNRVFPYFSWLQIAFPVLAFLMAMAYSSYLSGFSLGTFGSRFLTGGQLLKGGYLTLFGGACPSSDLGYVMLACESGLVSLCALAFLNWRCARLLVSYHLWNELLVLTGYGLFCFMEAYCTTISLNLGLLLLPILLYEKTRCRYLAPRTHSS